MKKKRKEKQKTKEKLTTTSDYLKVSKVQSMFVIRKTVSLTIQKPIKLGESRPKI